MFSFVLFLKAADAGRETQCDAGVGPSHNPIQAAAHRG